MEDPKKIIILFTAMLFISGCKVKEKYRNTDLFYKNEEGRLYLKIRMPNKAFLQHLPNTFFKDDSLYMGTVKDKNGNESKLKDIVHISQFDLLDNFLEDKAMFSKYYRSNPGECYFKDDRYFYILQFSDSSLNFFIAGNVNDYEILGEYVKVKDKIYYSGIELKGVDIKNFKTIPYIINNCEWQFDAGSDGVHIFWGINPVDYQLFKKMLFLNNTDSLRLLYFSNEINNK